VALSHQLSFSPRNKIEKNTYRKTSTRLKTMTGLRKNRLFKSCMVRVLARFLYDGRAEPLARSTTSPDTLDAMLYDESERSLGTRGSVSVRSGVSGKSASFSVSPKRQMITPHPTVIGPTYLL
jgi:hypothetical protein